MKVAKRSVGKDGKHYYDHYLWWCIGCNEAHIFANHHAPDYPGPDWEFDNNYEKPTVSPSILTDGSRPEKRCHVFIRAGMIEYLGDCWHKLAGQTVPMVDLPDWLANE